MCRLCEQRVMVRLVRQSNFIAAIGCCKAFRKVTAIALLSFLDDAPLLIVFIKCVFNEAGITECLNFGKDPCLMSIIIIAIASKKEQRYNDDSDFFHGVSLQFS